MQQFFNHRKKLILHAAIFIIGIVAVVLAGFLKYRYYMDTPHAPCYSAVDFVYDNGAEGRWSGQGDLSISMEGHAIYLYFRLTSPAGEQLTYNRRLEAEFDKLDTSRFLFNTKEVVIFDNDTAQKKATFMRRGLEGGMVTFSRFSDMNYYYNINNMLIGVCNVPT